MSTGGDGSLLDKGDFVGPESLEVVEGLNDVGANYLTCNLCIVFFGIHATLLDEAQANVDDIDIVHLEPCTAGIGCAGKRHRMRVLNPSAGCHLVAMLSQLACNF